MKRPKMYNRTHAQRCLDDIRITLLSYSTRPLLKQKDSHVGLYSAMLVLN